MKKIALLFLISTSLVCCNNDHNAIEKNIKNIDKEIKSLKTLNEKKNYLNELYRTSQGKVEEIDSLEKRFFENHTETHKLRRELDSVRAYNAYRAEAYLEHFSYPSDTIAYTKNEFDALYFALLHSSRVISMIKGMPYIKEQYEKGQLSGRYFLKYLNNIYYLDKTKFYQYDKTHTIDQLILDILPEIEQIKKSRNL